MMQPKLTVGSNAPKLDHAVGNSGEDPVIFDCFAPRTVVRRMSFDLMVLAYLRHQREEVLRDALKSDAVEAGMPKIIPTMLKKPVKVELVGRDCFFSPLYVSGQDHKSMVLMVYSSGPEIRSGA